MESQLYPAVVFFFFFASLKAFVLKTQVDLPEPKLAEFDQLTKMQPKLVKAVYEVTYSVDATTNFIDPRFHLARAASTINEIAKLIPNQPPTIIKVEAVTDSLVKKDDDEVPVIKGYDPDQTKRLAEALDEMKKQTDLKVKVDPPAGTGLPNRGGWSTPWRPTSRSNDRTPYYNDHGYLPPIPCCPSDHSRPTVY